MNLQPLALLGLLMFAGCQTVAPTHPDLGFGPDVPMHRAVLQYRSGPKATPIHAEATVALDPPGKFQLVAWKGPMVWLTVQMSASAWWVEFPTEHRTFSGKDPGWAPAQLEVWLAVRDALVKNAPRFQSATVTARNGATLHLQFLEQR